MSAESITITIKLNEVCSDVITKCNLISKQLGKDVDAEIRADIQSPDSDDTRSIICRAVTEAVGQIKYAAQRYLRSGRTTDNNDLERIGYTTTTGSGDNAVTSVTYESVAFELYIPNFNYAVTDALKSAMHLYVVDYIMYRFLQDQLNDKAAEYKAIAQNEDYPDIIVKLNARTTHRKPSFYKA